MRFLLILVCLFASSVQAKVNVVTSILPLQGITAAIMQGVGEPELLIKDQASAHHFAFRPSHFRALKAADLVIWIDRNFESGFQQLPDLLLDSTVQLELLPALNLSNQALSNQALSNQDGHIWYSPILLGRVIDQITVALSKLEPQNEDAFKRNQLDLKQAVSDWDESFRGLIANSKPRYLLDHNFLIHLEASFEIQSIATINDEHDQHGGIKELRVIERLLESGSAKCLLSNETSISKIGQNLAERYGLEIYKITDFSDQSKTGAGFMQHLWQLHKVLANCG